MCGDVFKVLVSVVRVRQLLAWRPTTLTHKPHQPHMPELSTAAAEPIHHHRDSQCKAPTLSAL